MKNRFGKCFIDCGTWTATDAIGRTVSDHAAAGDPKENRYVGLICLLGWVGAGQVVQDHTKQYPELGAKDAIKAIEERPDVATRPDDSSADTGCASVAALPCVIPAIAAEYVLCRKKKE